MRLYVKWVREGKIRWQQDWLKRHGPVRNRMPGRRDAISFANYDLRGRGLPEIQEDPSGRLFIDFPMGGITRESAPGFDVLRQMGFAQGRLPNEDDPAKAQDILDYHGFEWELP